MDTNLKAAQQSLAKSQTNNKENQVIPLNKRCDRAQPGREFLGKLADFLTPEEFNTISKSRKVKEFILAADTWKSGYSMGETVKISVQSLDGRTIKVIVKDTRAWYHINKYDCSVRHGDLTLEVDMKSSGLGRYSIVEKSKKGTPSYKEVLDAVIKNRKRQRAATKVRNLYENSRTVSEDGVEYAIRCMALRGNFVNRITKRQPVRKTVTFDNYYDTTAVDFQSITTGKTDEEILETWSHMRNHEDYEYHPSPLSSSKYLEDRDKGVVYRLSDHWGWCASCLWTLDGDAGMFYAIGRADLASFVRRIPDGFNLVFNDEGVRTTLQDNEDDIRKIEDLLSHYTFEGKSRDFFERLLQSYHKLNEAIVSRDMEAVIELSDIISSFQKDM